MRLSKDVQYRDQYIEQFDFPYCEEVSKYEKQAKIGQVKIKKFKSIWISWFSTQQGTFGEVFKARDRKNKHKVMGSRSH